MLFSKQGLAQTTSEDDYSVLPSNPKPGEFRTPVEQKPEVQAPKPPEMPVPVNPVFYKPTLPPLGGASAYLPSPTEALGVYLVVKLKARKVYVYQGDKAITSYPIAVGKPGWETPVGSYQVFSKEVNPIFKSFKTGTIIRPGPDNPLGIRWIGIWTDGKTQLGFHGTNQPELIGGAVSHGCIRMRNKDVLALFEQVSLGTPVKVEP
ncbi:L,D-transpeptidase [Kovacikia minuta CCNUW1]|uniref:L,D-transpeptidase n=1 Tax=Kovacikia minuta TaxID=2931930 RepID=UPI001CCF8EDC|nr:L,D-transpeptidase [Kovacikia minuta]UBF29035.1 L,D-transpeptidase [Kovacikia minuta CCNUW1]